MTKKLVQSVALLFHLKKFKIVMNFTAVLLLSVSFQIFAASFQQKTVTGRILDNNGQALTGVNVVEKGTTNGTISDVYGRYSLNVASANSVLVYSFIGFTSQEVTAGSQPSVNVTLVESAVGLDEIVVVGYGTQ